MDLDTCNKIIENISKRYNVIGKDWSPDGACTVKVKLPPGFSKGENIEVDFTFDEINGIVRSDMKVIIPYREKLRLIYSSNKPDVYATEVYTTNEDTNVVYKFTVGEEFDYSNNRYGLMQGWFIDDMLNGLMIKKY